MFLSGSVKKTPTILQMEAAECGAAALAIVLAHYGLHIPLEILRRDCGVNRDGATAGNIARAARLHGLTVEGKRVPADDLAAMPVPAVIHWNRRHFVVLEGFRRGRAYINDPGFGHRALSMDEFRSRYSGSALFMRPGDLFRPGGQRFSVVRELSGKLFREKAALLFVLLISLFLVVTGAATPLFTQVFLDDILSGDHADWLNRLLIVMAAVCVMEIILNGLRSWCLTRWQTKLALKDSAAFFWHVVRLPTAFFQQRFSGEIAMRTQFNENIANVLTGNLATAGLDFLVAFFFLFILVHMSWKLAAVGLFFTILNLSLLAVLRKRVFELAMRMQLKTAQYMGTAIGGLQSMETYKANGNENDFFAKWSGHQANVYRDRQRLDLLVGTMSVAPALTNALNTAFILLVGGFETMDGLMTVGTFIAFRNLMGNFQQPVERLFSLGRVLQSSEVQMRRIADVMNHEVDETVVAARESTGKARKLGGNMSMRDVTFGYGYKGLPFISLFDLDVGAGEWVALVGASGSGKSTVVNIAAGLLKEWFGETLFDGAPRKDVPRDVLSASVSYVGQNSNLFSGTVRDNITLFDSGIPDADIRRAAADAMIYDDILRMEGGFEHMLKEGGANLSFGQRQRLEIARALVVDPAILLLDEATSYLDSETEERLLENIRRRGCSCLMAAHRLSAFRDCNRIVVMDYGRAVQRGTHAEMMREDGPYRRLIAGQPWEWEG